MYWLAFNNSKSKLLYQPTVIGYAVVNLENEILNFPPQPEFLKNLDA